MMSNESSSSQSMLEIAAINIRVVDADVDDDTLDAGHIEQGSKSLHAATDLVCPVLRIARQAHI
jgi:hypothetical protein